MSSHVFIENRSMRSIVGQLRVGTLKLRIESGRFVGEAREERLCPLCKQEPETEVHFLFDCCELQAVREEWQDKYPLYRDLCNRRETSSYQKYIDIWNVMTIEKEKLIYALWKKRKEILYF